MAWKITNYFERDGKFFARISYTDALGRRRQKAKLAMDEDGISSKSAIPKALRELQQELEDGGPQALAKSHTSLSEYLAQWLELTKHKRAEKTNADYESLIRIHIKPAIGSVQLGKLREKEIQALYNSMLHRGLSSRTVRYVHAVLSCALKQAVKWEEMKKNPAANVELPKREHNEMQTLNEGEVKRFLQACSQDKLGLIFELALYSGMRPEEYLGLQWKDIDFEQGVVRIQRKMRYRAKGGGWYFGELKTKKSKRSIPLDEYLLTALKQHRIEQKQRAQKLFESSQRWEEHNLVFTTEVGTPISKRNLERRHFKPILQKAELPNIRLYDLRHTCATLLLMKGTDVKTVSEWLGHANASETLNTYSHVLPSMKAQASRNIAQAMRG
jgi:integrase